MNRQYQITNGRFSRPDPYEGSYDLGNPQSLNRFGYVNNDPVNATDPLGLMLECVGDGEGGTVCWDDGSGRGGGWDIGDDNRGGGGGGTNPRKEPLPCNNWDQQLSDMKEIARNLGGKIDLNETKKDNITYIAEIKSSQEKVVAGFPSFFDPLPEHAGGTDVKTMVNQRWYHLTVGYGHRDGIQYRRGRGGDVDPYPARILDNTKPPSFVTIHCDDHEPGTVEHLWKDWVLPRIKRLPKFGPLLPPTLW